MKQVSKAMLIFVLVGSMILLVAPSVQALSSPETPEALIPVGMDTNGEFPSNTSGPVWAGTVTLIEYDTYDESRNITKKEFEIYVRLLPSHFERFLYSGTAIIEGSFGDPPYDGTKAFMQFLGSVLQDLNERWGYSFTNAILKDAALLSASGAARGVTNYPTAIMDFQIRLIK
jgi:hypothetical protein